MLSGKLLSTGTAMATLDRWCNQVIVDNVLINWKPYLKTLNHWHLAIFFRKSYNLPINWLQLFMTNVSVYLNGSIFSVCSRLTAYLEFWVGIEHDVFNGALDVLSPAGQPRHSVVISNLLPVVTSRRHWVTGFSVGPRKSVYKQLQHWSINLTILQRPKPPQHKCLTPVPEMDTTNIISMCSICATESE